MSTVIEHNAETGEIIERPQTAAEIKQAEIDTKAQADLAAEKIAKAQAKQAVLDRLGLTPAEAKLLIS
jgi:hypothetical protein